MYVVLSMTPMYVSFEWSPFRKKGGLYFGNLCKHGIVIMINYHLFSLYKDFIPPTCLFDEAYGNHYHL